MSKAALVVAVGAVSALSVGAGTFLAFRANQTPAVVDTPAAVALAPRGADVTPAPAIQERPAIAGRPAPAPRQAETQPTRVATPDATPRPAPPATPVEPVAQPPVPTPTLAPVETPPVTTASAAAAEPPPVQEPPKPRFEELTVKQNSVVGIKIDQAVSSETARVEDRVTAKITRDVTVDGRTAIAAGTRLEGVVTMVERGGKFKERARLAIRFNTLVLADGLRVPIQTEAILREGDSPSSAAGSKIGASAVAGAIIGGLIGGKRGAVVGSTAGAAGGTAVVAAGGRHEAVIQNGAALTVLLTAPVTITIERDPLVR